MKKIYIGLLILNSFVSFSSYAKADYLRPEDSFETIENYSFQTIIGRDAGTIGNIDQGLFKSAHRVIAKEDAINDTYYILSKLNSDSKLLYSQFIDNNKTVEKTDVAVLYKFDTIHLNKREAPITADDIIKVNKKFDQMKRESEQKSTSLFESLFGSSFSDKHTAKKDTVAKKPETTAYSYTENKQAEEDYAFHSVDKTIISEEYTADVIGVVNNYNQKELVKELTHKGLFNKAV